ncbi:MULTISPECIES: MFS transporter [unclassified Legionella]|uniref:MFS transporter n=1 Tax=unclassified Legionella TaxID=2622702 RepID=UPI0010564C47|nr:MULTISPECIES: MFS transporter [unclassified Legionella]MDI9819478.1 MFS transporter [Legionella sp. PL877]
MRNSIIFLLKKKVFLPLFFTQFFGAFNDNAFKLAMLTLISYHVSDSIAQSEQYQAIAGALFIAPFFLFSATAGQLADKYDKSTLAVWLKLFELILMIIGGFSLYLQSVFLMMGTLTGMGLHSTFFGPIKYAILPDHLPRQELLGATSLIEGSTFMAILLGTTLGALSIGSSNSHTGYAILLTNVAAMAGLVASLFIPKAPPKAVDLEINWNIFHATMKVIRGAVANRQVMPAVFTISWFWLVGAIMLTKLPDYTHYILRADTSVFAFFLALFSIGIALGAFIIGYLLAGKITLRYVPITMFLLSLFAVDLYRASPGSLVEKPLQSLVLFLSEANNWRITLDFFFFSFCAGLFVVPLYTYIQVVSEEGKRARTIAMNNIFNALFMVIGTGFVLFLLYLRVTIPMVFFILAILNTIVALGVWVVLYKLNGFDVNCTETQKNEL